MRLFVALVLAFLEPVATFATIVASIDCCVTVGGPRVASQET
jgi:hypothetical protein